MSFIWDDPQTILQRIREKRTAKIADIAESLSGDKNSNISNPSNPEAGNIRCQIKSLIKQRAILMEMKQSCLKVRACTEYKTFSVATLKAEAEGLARLDADVEAINKQLSILFAAQVTVS